MNQSEVRRLIAEECEDLKAMLLEKNAAYGNSALDPVRVFSRASAREQILVRIDDKLSRISRGSAAGEDVVLDLLGYFILLRVADRMDAPGSQEPHRDDCEESGEGDQDDAEAPSMRGVDPERLCMYDGCTEVATHYQAAPAHWHDWIWCDEHRASCESVPL